MIAPEENGRKEALADLPTVSQVEAAQSLPDIVNRAGYAGQRTVITRYGKPFAAVVSLSDVEFLQQHAPAA